MNMYEVLFYKGILYTTGIISETKPLIVSITRLSVYKLTQYMAKGNTFHYHTHTVLDSA